MAVVVYYAMPGMLSVVSNGVVVVGAAVERVEKIRLPTGEWRLTTRIDEDRAIAADFITTTTRAEEELI